MLCSIHEALDTKGEKHLNATHLVMLLFPTGGQS